EEAWGCTAYNHYGMTEMGLGGGVECRARCGYHLREADLLFEIVDLASGAPLPDGEEGEIVFTTLTRAGMPLIRYRTGDAGHILAGPCPCGSRLRRLARVTHRLEGRHSLAGATLTMADLDEALFPLPALVGFSATLSRTAPRRLHITIEALPGAADCRAAAEAALRALPTISQATDAGVLQLALSQQGSDPARGATLRKRVIGEQIEGEGSN
ncbi:MAG: phenylacetate--CoA ligase family protein, partial [Oscillochloris sp.]|nr:phenylacetate--CoA ligase family protein [Oscillochloris sp.]